MLLELKTSRYTGVFLPGWLGGAERVTRQDATASGNNGIKTFIQHETSGGSTQTTHQLQRQEGVFQSKS
jgi:hypothetical protein